MGERREGNDDYWDSVTGQRLILHDKRMGDKETSTWSQSGQSLNERAGEDTTGQYEIGETNCMQYDPSGSVGIMQTKPYAMNLCLLRTISHISCYPLLVQYYFITQVYIITNGFYIVPTG
jgi:hypothetical protein